MKIEAFTYFPKTNTIQPGGESQSPPPPPKEEQKPKIVIKMGTTKNSPVFRTVIIETTQVEEPHKFERVV